MRTIMFFKYCLLIAVALPSLAIAQTNNTQSEVEPISTPEWVVVLDDPRPARLQGWVNRGYGKSSSGNYRSALELERFGKAVANKYKMELRDQWFIPSLGVYCLIVRFNQDQNTTIAQLKKNKSVQWVQPSNEFELLSASVTPKLTENAPITQASTQATVQASVHSIKPGIDGSGVVIAIIDSAIDDSHQDLTGQIDKVGDFVITRERRSAGKKQQSGESHGTAIAGVMVSDINTKLGVAGVAPAATLQAYRACWEASETKQTNCNTLSLARALDAVLNSQADILNLSLSGPKDRLLDRLLQRIIDRGTIVVTAFDPKRPQRSRFPSERDGVIVVRAAGLDKQHSGFTAPGARVVASPGNNYNFMHGHSVASAYTSGLLALRKQISDSGRKLSDANNDWREVSPNSAAQELLDEIHQY